MYLTAKRKMKIALLVCVIFCSSVLAYKPNPDDYGPPLPPWLRIYLGLNYVFKEDVDLVHVVVGTKFVTEPNFEKAKRAAKLLTKAVDVLTPSGIDEGGSQIGFIQVSDPKKTKKEFRLGKYDTFGENKDAILSVKFQNGGGPAQGKGLMLARKMFKRHGLNDNKVVFLLTNTAKDEGKYEAIAEASELKKQGVRVCVVCIGKPHKWVSQVASGKCHQCYPSYQKFLSIVQTAVQQILQNNPE